MLFILFFIVVVVIKAESSAEGAKYALEMCAGTVIPSLFPFMIISSYLLKSDLFSSLGQKGEKVCRCLFDLPKESGVIFLMSLIGGFPVGAKMISDCVKNGKLTSNQGKRMLLFCVNPGPAFVINIVGVFMLGSKKAGVIILTSLCASSFVSGIASRVFKKDEEITVKYKKVTSYGILYESVNDSIKSMISICAWIVIFGAIQFIINDISLPQNAKLWLAMVSEVTNGCRIAASEFPLPITAFILGWSGFSVHAQIMQYVSSVGLRYKYFFVARMINAAMSFGVSSVLFKLFPCEVSVFSNVSEIIPQAVSVSVPAAIAMIFLFALVILDLAPGRKV